MSSDENRKEDSQWYLSPTLITRYARKSSRLIHSIEKNILVVVGVVGALVIISVVDTLEIIGITDLIGESLDDTIIAILSLVSLAALLPILRLSFRSKRILEEWAEMFEYNSIKNSITMSLTSTKRDDILQAVAETVEEVGSSLLQYLEKGEYPELFDRDVGGYVYDVLLDVDTVKAEKGIELKKILADYGAIIIRIHDGKISRSDVETFSNSLKSYAINKRKSDAIGLAIMVGREVDPEANIQYGKAKDILLIEHP